MISGPLSGLLSGPLSRPITPIKGLRPPFGHSFAVNQQGEYAINTDRRFRVADTGDRVRTTPRIKDVASARGLQFGAYGLRESWVEPGGVNYVAGLKQLMLDESDILVPDLSGLPDYFATGDGTFSWGGLDYFVDECQANGKDWRWHTAFYDTREAAGLPWTATGINSGNYYAKMEERIAAFAARYAYYLPTDVDGVNEATYGPGGATFETGPWANASAYGTVTDLVGNGYTGPMHLAAAYILLDEYLPGVRHWYCDNALEQQFSNNQVLRAALIQDFFGKFALAGIPLHGMNYQMHLTLAYGYTRKPMIDSAKWMRDNGFGVMIGELDVRIASNGYQPPLTQTSMTARELRQRSADLVHRVLDDMLPYVTGPITTWVLSDARTYNLNTVGQAYGLTGSDLVPNLIYEGVRSAFEKLELV